MTRAIKDFSIVFLVVFVFLAVGSMLSGGMSGSQIPQIFADLGMLGLTLLGGPITALIVFPEQWILFCTVGVVALMLLTLSICLPRRLGRIAGIVGSLTWIASGNVIMT